MAIPTLPAPPSAKPKLSLGQKLSGGQMRKLLPRLRPHRGAIFIASVMLLASTALGLAFPLVVGKIFDGSFLPPAGTTVTGDKPVTRKQLPSAWGKRYNAGVRGGNSSSPVMDLLREKVP